MSAVHPHGEHNYTNSIKDCLQYHTFQEEMGHTDSDQDVSCQEPLQTVSLSGTLIADTRPFHWIRGLF